jgi:rubrerythrin
MFKEGPLRSFLRGPVMESLDWSDFHRMSVDALPGETDAYDLYTKLAWMARMLGQEDLAIKYAAIASDEMDHYRIIRNEIIPAIASRRMKLGD